MSSHPISEVAERFEEYAARVAEQGEPMVVTRDGEPLVEVRPVPHTPKPRTLGEVLDALEDLRRRHLTDEEFEEFARDVEEGRKELNALPLRDPWAS